MPELKAPALQSRAVAVSRACPVRPRAGLDKGSRGQLGDGERVAASMQNCLQTAQHTLAVFQSRICPSETTLEERMRGGGGSGGLKAAGAEGGGGAGGSGGVGFGTLSLGAEHGAFHSRKQIALDKLTAVLMAHCKPSSADKHSLPRMWYISVCRLLPKLSMISSNCSRAPWVTNRAYAISLRQKLHTGHWQLRHMNDKLIDDNCTASHLHALCTDSCFSSQVRINKHVAGMNCASQSVSRQLRQSPSLVNMIQHTD